MTEREHMIARLKKCDSNVWGKNGLIHCITDGPIHYRRNKSGSYVKQATEKLVRHFEEMAERIIALEAENAKLRELAKDLLKNCLESPFWPRDTNSLRIRCRHMGIEMDDE